MIYRAVHLNQLTSISFEFEGACLYYENGRLVHLMDAIAITLIYKPKYS